MRKFWAQRLLEPSQSVTVPRGTIQETRTFPKRPPPRRAGHKHNQNSRWSQNHRLYNLAREEIRDVYNAAYRDPITAEVVALKESVLLDVDKGEVLQHSLRYQRKFDILNKPGS